MNTDKYVWFVGGQALEEMMKSRDQEQLTRPLINEQDDAWGFKELSELHSH